MGWAYRILLAAFLAFGFQSKAQLFEFKRQGNWWTNNASMQYNPEVGTINFNIPLPIASNTSDIVPTFSNITSPVTTYPIHDDAYQGQVYWPPGTTNLAPTVISFEVAGSPPPTFKWGIAEGNYLSNRLPFDYSLTGPQGQIITPGGNWLGGAQVITNNTVGTYTLTFTHKPTFAAAGTATAFVIESSLGKVAMKIGYTTTDVRSTIPDPDPDPDPRPNGINGWSQWYRLSRSKPPVTVPIPLSNHTPYTKSNLFFPLRGRAGLRGNYRKYR